MQCITYGFQLWYENTHELRTFFIGQKKATFLYGLTNYNFVVVLTISFCTGVKEIYFINPKFQGEPRSFCFRDLKNDFEKALFGKLSQLVAACIDTYIKLMLAYIFQNNNKGEELLRWKNPRKAKKGLSDIFMNEA